MDALRDSIFGQTVRFASNGRFLSYKDETHQFEKLLTQLDMPESLPMRIEGEEKDEESLTGSVKNVDKSVGLSRTEDGLILVGWYSSDDIENPQNWGNLKKYLVSLLICFTTFSFYMGTSIYNPSQPYVMEEFNVGLTAASWGMVMYILGYGIGPMLWSPLSEIPAIGRTTTYVVTFTIFVILLVPTSLVQNFAGLLILRFLLGFFGSPCLAIAGASFQDIFPPGNVFYAVGIWAAAATCDPSLGPALSAFSIKKYGWRWSQWEILWLAGPLLVLMILVLPETSASTIQLRRAHRLRKATGNDSIRAQAEIDQAQLSVKDITFNALIKPREINILDPAVLYTTFYTGLLYGILYTYFEVFPLVYQDVYHFDSRELSLVFLSMIVNQVTASPLYMAYFHFRVEPRIAKHGMGPIEDFLYAGLVAGWILPAGLFLFDIHWIVSVVGAVVATAGVYVTTQCMYLYVPFCYPKYAASLMAANGLSRSVLAAAAILFAPPMFKGMGVPGGVSFLAALTVVCRAGLFVLYFFGAKLRARSRFAGS